jgi:hypothetical protein
MKPFLKDPTTFCQKIMVFKGRWNIVAFSLDFKSKCIIKMAENLSYKDKLPPFLSFFQRSHDLQDYRDKNDILD